MKTIILSFDDARRDFYTRAFPIMKKYGLPSTLNVISSYLSDFNREGHISFPSSKQGISIDQLLECYKSGLVEIACHGANHLNTKEDVERNLEELRGMGVGEQILGFASPESVITEQNKNEKGIWKLVEDGQLLYVRSGIQIRREGYVYAALSLLDRYIHSNSLFRYLNRKNVIINVSNDQILPSVAIFSYTKLHQVFSFIEKLKDSSATILMFHSILRNGDEGYGCDRYYWDAEEFESLCAFLKSRSDIRVCMTKDLIEQN